MNQSLALFSKRTWNRNAANLCCGFLLIWLAACQTAPTTPQTVTTTTTPQATHIPSPTPTPTPITPPLRSDTQLAYDGKSGTLLLFSGGGSGNVISWDDTWTWDGTTWTQQHPLHAPSSRSDVVMAYDAKTGQVVLFGGSSNLGNTPMLADTWTWDGTDWTQQHPAVSPPARDFASMAYDATTGQLLLFGGGGNGQRIAGLAPPSLNDTWDWNGTSWTQLHPTTVPAARTQPGMAYDAAIHDIVLYGGNEVNSNGPHNLDDTWLWNGSNWIQQHPAASPLLSGTFAGQPLIFEQIAMTYNEAAQQVMVTLQGTNADGTGSIHTEMEWFWNGTTWTPSSWTQQQALGNDLFGGPLVYDPAIQSVVQWTASLPIINGVHSAFFVDKLWQWNGQSWKLLENWQ